MPAIGFLQATSLEAMAELLRGFHLGLKEAGYVEGENVAIEYRFADNQHDQLPALAADLVRRVRRAVDPAGHWSFHTAKTQLQTFGMGHRKVGSLANCLA